MSLINYYSLISYTVLVPGENYTLDFPYLFKSDIVVFKNGDIVPDSEITWTSDTSLTVANTVINDEIYIRRYTRRDARWADYQNGGSLTEMDLNIVSKQLLYLIQELWDAGLAGTDPNAPPGSSGNPGEGDNTLPSLIDDIINELLQTQLFADLVELIALVDINAENVMQASLDNHRTWEITQVLDQTVDSHTIQLSDIGISLSNIDAEIIDLEATQITNFQTLATQISGVAVRLDTAEANIIQANTAIATLDSATALSINQLQAGIDDNNALILTVEQAAADSTSALSSRVDVLQVDLESDIAAADARIGTIESAYVDEAEATAIATTQIDVKFQNHDWEGQFNSSSYISGIEASASESASNINSIESFLVGFGGTLDDPESWTPSSAAGSIAGLQTTVEGHATDINSNIDFRTAMFAAFYPSGNTSSDSTQMVAAMEQRWQTYADSESSVVSQINTLQANQQPIFFRVTAPDPRDVEFQSSPWFNVGFPDGSLWHNIDNQTRIVTYFWYGSNSSPPGITPDDVVSFPGIVGMWVRAIDDVVETQGASINQLTTAYNNLGVVGGSITSTIQAVVGADIAAIEETLESWVEPDGIMYSSWNVRINQYNQGIPVIAGIGLGMQTDPDNPANGSRSDFIVMADYFSIIKPPSAADLVNGQWDTSTVFVPFIVNSGNVPGEPDVMINGDLFVRNTLSAVDGMAGRFTFTNLDGNGYPMVRDGNYNALGSRMVLCSDTNDFNVGVGASPFPGGSNPQKFWMWAGSGAMSHNNAVFYVDTDGNAFFGGQVAADNIDGDLSNAFAVSVHNGTTTVPNGSTAWHTLGSQTVSPSTSGRERQASATVTVSMFGTGAEAGRARLLLSYETSPGSNNYSTPLVVSDYPIGMEIGTSLTLSGTHPSKTKGKWRVEVQISRQQGNSGAWQYPSSSGYDGTLLLLS